MGDEFRARIGRIRMKSGGADVRVLHRAETNFDGDDWRGRIVAHAKSVAGQATDEAPLVGFLIVGMFQDGGCSTGFRWDNVRCPVPRALVPAWVAEVARRDIITEPEAQNVFNDMFEWQDGAS